MTNLSALSASEKLPAALAPATLFLSYRPHATHPAAIGKSQHMTTSLVAMLPANIAVHVLFVAFSVYVQTLTGFALALVLLGLVGLTQLFPLPDAVHAVSFITVINAVTFLWRRRPIRIEPAMETTVLASMAGSFVGMGILTYLAAHSLHLLRTLFDLIVIGCALLLWRMGWPRETTSPPRVFSLPGLILARAMVIEPNDLALPTAAAAN